MGLQTKRLSSHTTKLTTPTTKTTARPTGAATVAACALVLASLISLASVVPAAAAAAGEPTEAGPSSRPNCQPIHFGARERLVCKCDRLHCAAADLEFEWPQGPAGGRLVRVVSSKAGKRFHVDQLEVAGLQQQQAAVVDQLVELDVNRRQQEIVGYGGAFTDSAAQLLRELPAGLRGRLLASYFGPTGLAYNLARVPIGGTDMSSRPYSCNDLAEGQHDFQLAKFSLQREDLEFKLPLIREAARLVAAAGEQDVRRPARKLRLLFSSWSAPNWMKTNHSLVQGQLKGEGAGGPYYDAYARYSLKFIEAYERQLHDWSTSIGDRLVDCWAMTPQNEPCTPSRLGHKVVNYNSVNFEPNQMAAYLNDHLVPQLVRQNRTGARRLALFVWDDTLLGLDRYKSALVGAGMSAAVYDYVRGLALHWYSQGLDKLPYKSLYDVRRWLPQKFSLLSTEASFIGRPRPGDWSRAVRYARDIIENLRVGAVGWLDWNLALDLEGGPTWSSNFLDAALLVDPRAQAAYKQPMFYAIGHVSRFLRAGAHVLPSQVYSPRGAALADNSTTGGGGSSSVRSGLGWKMIDEEEEQTSELLVAAAELAVADSAGGGAGDPRWRRVGLVLLSRANRTLSVRLSLANCRHDGGGGGDGGGQSQSQGPLALTLDLEPESITSLALNC